MSALLASKDDNLKPPETREIDVRMDPSIASIETMRSAAADATETITRGTKGRALSAM
jgi:hypothetical protein